MLVLSRTYSGEAYDHSDLGGMMIRALRSVAARAGAWTLIGGQHNVELLP